MALQSNISSDMVVVEPGATAPLTIDVENLGESEDQIEVSIEGVDGEWIAIPVPVITLKPGEKQAVKVFFKPPRFSESIAGNYPFVAKVRSLNDGDTRSAQGVLTIKPYFSLTLEVTPKKGFISPTKRQNIFTVSLMNMGNSEQMIQLTADDPEDVCAYEFDEEQVVLGPGQQKDIDFLVNPKKGSPFGSSRLIGFAITGRSLSNSGIVASSQGQLEIRPLFTPVNVSLLLFAFVVMMGLWLTAPKPPSIILERVTKSKVYKDGMVTVHWTAEHAASVRLISGGVTFKDNLGSEGTEDIPAPLVGTLKIQAVATRNKRQATSEIIEIEVEEPIVIPDPEILQFEPSKREVNKGEKFTINYKFKNATKASVAPLGQDLNLTFNSQQFDAGELGETTYTVAAYNSAGKSVMKSFKVNVVDRCLAKIVKFEVTPIEVEPENGRVTISWHVTTALRILLTYTGTNESYVLEAVGSREIPVIGKTNFKIQAFDASGKSVSQSKTVTIKQPDPPADNNAPPIDGTTGTLGTTTGL
jgi:hypothetical protein